MSPSVRLRLYLTVVAALVVCLTTQVMGGAPWSLQSRPANPARNAEPRTISVCNLGQVVEEILIDTKQLGGFENRGDCWLSSRAAPVGMRPPEPNVDGDWRARLDRLTEAHGFEWRELHGQLVIRPSTAWSDPSNPLNLPVGSFELTGDISRVLARTFESAEPNLYLPYRRQGHQGPNIDRMITVRFGGGTLLDALSAITEAHGDLGWSFGYQRSGANGLLVYSISSPDEFLGVPVKSPRRSPMRVE